MLMLVLVLVLPEFVYRLVLETEYYERNPNAKTICSRHTVP